MPTPTAHDLSAMINACYEASSSVGPDFQAGAEQHATRDKVNGYLAPYLEDAKGSLPTDALFQLTQLFLPEIDLLLSGQDSSELFAEAATGRAWQAMLAAYDLLDQQRPVQGDALFGRPHLTAYNIAGSYLTLLKTFDLDYSMNSLRDKTSLRLSIEMFYHLCPPMVQKTESSDLFLTQEHFSQFEAYPNPCNNAAVTVLYDNLDFTEGHPDLLAKLKVILTELQQLNAAGFLTDVVKHQWWDSEFIQKKGRWLTLQDRTEQTLQLTDIFLNLAWESASPQTFEEKITATRNQLEAVALRQREIAVNHMQAVAAIQAGRGDLALMNVRTILQDLIDTYNKIYCIR